MPRLQNSRTGVVVNVSEATAKGMTADWATPKAAAEDKPRSESPDGSWKVAELKAHAAEHGIDLGEATKKEDVLAAITAASDTE